MGHGLTVIGVRARFGEEKCPSCNNPGCGMFLVCSVIKNCVGENVPAGALDPNAQWICSRCVRALDLK